MLLQATHPTIAVFYVHGYTAIWQYHYTHKCCLMNFTQIGSGSTCIHNHSYVYVLCVCVRVCVRACVCVCVRTCVCTVCTVSPLSSPPPASPVQPSHWTLPCLPPCEQSSLWGLQAQQLSSLPTAPQGGKGIGGEGRGRVLTQKVERNCVQSKLAVYVCVCVHKYNMFARSLCSFVLSAWWHEARQQTNIQQPPSMSCTNRWQEYYEFAYCGLEKTQMELCREV